MTTELQSVASSDALDYELRIDAPPSLVWSFWVEPERLVRWMGSVATLEPRPRGVFRIDYGQGDVVAGEFVEVDAPRRLVLSWAWESADPVHAEASRVEVELDAIEGGTATLLRLRHLGLTEPTRISHDEGWRHFLPRLPEAVAGATA